MKKSGWIATGFMLVVIALSFYYGFKEFQSVLATNTKLEKELEIRKETIRRLGLEYDVLEKEKNQLSEDLEEEKKNIKVKKEFIYVEVGRVKELSSEEQYWLLRGWLGEEGNFPARMEVDGDTLVAITDNQARQINIVKTERDGCEDLADSLEKYTITLLKKIDVQELQISNCLEQKKLEQESVNQLSQAYKEEQRKNKSLRGQRTALGVISVVLGAIIIF